VTCTDSVSIKTELTNDKTILEGDTRFRNHSSNSPVAHHAQKLEQLVGPHLELAIYNNMQIATYFNL